MVMHGTKQGKLYILQGSTIKDSISTITQSRSQAPNGLSDNSLWHLCLGYMSEHLDILSKRGLHGNRKVKPFQFCEHYVYEKHHQMKFPNIVHTKAMLDYAHSNC